VQNLTFEHGNATGRDIDGGSGGGIYTDGDQYTVTVSGTLISGNHARAAAGNY
jgi:hypothetical protein